MGFQVTLHIRHMTPASLHLAVFLCNLDLSKMHRSYKRFLHNCSSKLCLKHLSIFLPSANGKVLQQFNVRIFFPSFSLAVTLLCMESRQSAKILLTVPVHIEETKNIAAHKIKQKILFYPLFQQCCYFNGGIFINSDYVKNTVIEHIYVIEIVIEVLNILATISTYLPPQFQMLILKTSGVWFGSVVFVVIIFALLWFFHGDCDFIITLEL